MGCTEEKNNIIMSSSKIVACHLYADVLPEKVFTLTLFPLITICVVKRVYR